MNKWDLEKTIDKIVEESTNSDIPDCRISLDGYYPGTTNTMVIKIVPDINPLLIEIDLGTIYRGQMALKSLIEMGAARAKKDALDYAFKNVELGPDFLTENSNIPKGKMICNPETRYEIIDKCMEFPECVQVSKMLFEGP